MGKYYCDLYDEIMNCLTIDTHCHHIPDNPYPKFGNIFHVPDDHFEGFNLDKILETSYVEWCGVKFDSTYEGRRKYLDKVKYKAFFRALQKSIMKIYKIDSELTPENWDYYNSIISETYKENKDWQLTILKEFCKFEKIILDAYWKPGDDNGHPELYTPTFRIDPFFCGYDKNVLDHDGFNVYKHYGKEFTNIDEFIDFTHETIKFHVQHGCYCLKNAIAYDRTLEFRTVTKEDANKVFEKKNYSKEDVANFQDYLFNEVCRIAAELDVPIQCHTGMGQIGNTRAINMLNVIKQNKNTKFSLMHGSFPWTSDILAYMDMYPNVYSDVVWLPALSPTTGEYVLHQLIEVGTSDKVFWGCDSWNSEESYGAKMTMADVLAKVLETKILNGYFSVSHAHELISKIMRDNAKELFKI